MERNRKFEWKQETNETTRVQNKKKVQMMQNGGETKYTEHKTFEKVSKPLLLNEIIIPKYIKSRQDRNVRRCMCNCWMI